MPRPRCARRPCRRARARRPADNGTQLFTALTRALADVPRQRLAGVGDDHRRRGARRAAGDAIALGLRRAAARAAHRPARTRPTAASSSTQAPSFGLVGKELSSTCGSRICRTAARPATARRASPGARMAAPPQPRVVPVGRDVPLTVADRPRRPQRPRARGRARAARADARQQPRRARRQRRARPAARCCWCRGEPHAGERVWRNILKSDPVGRSRPFHHPAAAGKAGRHADPRAVADRLSDPRAVRRQARRVRPDHLRPLQPPRRPAAGLSREHRALCAEGRRAARSGRPELRHADEPLPHAARRDPAGRADRQCLRGGLQAAADRCSAAAIPVTDELPGEPAGRRAAADWGRWFRQVEARAASRRHGDERRSTASRCWCSTASARAASRSCSPTRCGCGRAASRAAARRPSCCAASSTG